MFIPSVVFAAGASPVPASWSLDRCVNTTALPGHKIATIQGLECLFQNVVTVVTALAGLAVFIMLLTGGLKYLTSGGDPKAQEQAKGTLTFAVLGLVLIIAAYLILNFLSVFTGIPNLTKFVIPGP